MERVEEGDCRVETRQNDDPSRLWATEIVARLSWLANHADLAMVHFHARIDETFALLDLKS